MRRSRRCSRCMCGNSWPRRARTTTRPARCCWNRPWDRCVRCCCCAGVTSRAGAVPGRPAACSTSRASCSRSARCSRRARCARPTPRRMTASAFGCPPTPCRRWRATARRSPTFSSGARCTSSSLRGRRCARPTRRRRCTSKRSKRRCRRCGARRCCRARPTSHWRRRWRRCMTRRVGSVVVVDAQQMPRGILTRHDILGRVTLPALPLATPIGAVMSAPVHVLEASATLQDAALLMSRHGVRHVPVCERGALVDIVSERDLFALQRLSLKGLSTRIRAAGDLPTLQRAAQDIRRFARNLLGQGVQARQLTELISHLNDLLTTSLVQLLAREQGIDLQRACWLAFGSEGRSEQTIATDQDNGLVFASDDPQTDRPAWLRFARTVNDALDACGYPLCKGNVMASNPQCCLTRGRMAGALCAVDRTRRAAGSAERQHLFRSAADCRAAGTGEAAVRDAVARAGSRAAVHQADGRQRADEPRAARLARRACHARRRRASMARSQAARHRAVRRRGEAVHAGPRNRRIQHARRG